MRYKNPLLGPMSEGSSEMENSPGCEVKKINRPYFLMSLDVDIYILLVMIPQYLRR